MKTLLTLFVVTLALAFSASAQTASISAKDLKPLEGSLWVGTLTYLDYGSNKKTSIKSKVTITRPDRKGRIWIFEYIYPDEPKANSKGESVLSPDGRTFDGETVIENTKLAGGARRVVTTKSGTDNNRNALYRLTYTFSSRQFSVRKDVLVEGSTEYFERNTYSWTR